MALTQDRLKTVLGYDPETGSFVWLVGGHGVRVGDVAGWQDAKGYVQIKISGRKYRAHRLAWFWMTGAWPAVELDHRNGAGTDNRWENLREATKSLNMQNRRRAHRNNGTGLLGVSPAGKRFKARIKLDGKQRHLGSFPDAGSAHAAYLEAKRKLHLGCTI